MKIMASKSDHCFSGGSKNFYFIYFVHLVTPPVISHSPIYMCVHYPHIPPWFFTREGKKVLETWLSFSDRLYGKASELLCNYYILF